MLREFAGRTAVVTGAASGIGAALSKRAADLGMRVVLADVDEPALTEFAERLNAAGASVLAVATDVARLDHIERLAEVAVGHFGPVHLLCNNAGIVSGGAAWATSADEWQQILDINLGGVVHGVREFLPGMLAHGQDAHVVNTASMASLLPNHPSAPYIVSKYGVMGLSLQLDQTLRMQKSRVGVSVLCPGFVRTAFTDPEVWEMLEADYGDRLPILPPEEVADQTFAAVAANRFYIFTHPQFMPWYQTFVNETMAGRNPSLLHPPGSRP